MTTPETMEERFRQKFPFAIIDWKPGQENDGDGISVDKMLEILDFIRQEITLAVQKREEEEAVKCIGHSRIAYNRGLIGLPFETDEVLNLLTKDS